MGFPKRYIGNSRGQAMVEMALVMPILIVMLFSIMEFGRILNEKIVITAAAREGARSAAVGDSESAVHIRVLEAAQTVDTGEFPIQVDVTTSGIRGTSVEVRVTHQVRLLTPFISSRLGLSNPYPVTGISVMRLE